MSINVPNTLSVFRILLTPIFVICLMRGLFSLALLFFTIAGISDALDGLAARYLNQRTVLGTYLDPLADKILLMSAFVGLAVLKIIPGWLTVIVISRDVIIMVGYAVFEITDMRHKIRVTPSMISKFTTLFQLASVFLTLLNPDVGNIRNLLYWLTAGLTIISGLHYIYIGMNIFQNGGSENQS